MIRVVLTLLCLTNFAWGDDKHPEGVKVLDQIQKFFTDNKLEQRPYGSVTLKEKLNPTTISDFTNRFVLHGLARKSAALIFQNTYTTEQVLYAVGPDGNAKLDTAKNTNRVQASLCELTVMRSAVKVHGYCRNLANDKYDATGWVQLITDARVTDDKLVLTKDVGTLGDCFDGTERFYTCGSTSVETYSIVDGKLVLETALTKYRINPDTRERTRLDPTKEGPDVTYTDKEL